MGKKPFIDLPVQRGVSGLPPEVCEFYSGHEGIGLETEPNHADLRFCMLQEIAAVRWKDLHLFGRHPPERGWEDFSGYRLGMDSFFDEIFLVESSPVCKRGSIITIGIEVAGHGGTGPDTLEYALVLADDFKSWIRRLEEDDWLEYGLFPGGIADLPEVRADALNTLFHRLNPKVQWAKPGK